MFALLGSFVFELAASPTAMDGCQGYDYAEHAVIEGKPRLQFVGDGLAEKNMTLRLHQDFCDPRVQYNALIAAANTHDGFPLLMGNGDYLGHYVILKIGNVLEAAAADGTPIYLEVTLTLREWVDGDPIVTKKEQARANAPARKKNKNKNKKMLTTKKVDSPQLSAASRAGGYKIVSGNKIVRSA